MKTIATTNFSESIGHLHHETLQWLKETQFYLDEIQVFQRLIHTKVIPNNVCHQIERDVDLNLNAMADKIHKEVIKDLHSHESYLSKVSKNNINIPDEDCSSKHSILAINIENVKIALIKLKEQVHKFMLQKEFGVRSSRMNSTLQ